MHKFFIAAVIILPLYKMMVQYLSNVVFPEWTISKFYINSHLEYWTYSEVKQIPKLSDKKLFEIRYTDFETCKKPKIISHQFKVSL